MKFFIFAVLAVAVANAKKKEPREDSHSKCMAWADAGECKHSSVRISARSTPRPSYMSCSLCRRNEPQVHDASRELTRRSKYACQKKYFFAHYWPDSFFSHFDSAKPAAALRITTAVVRIGLSEGSALETRSTCFSTVPAAATVLPALQSSRKLPGTIETTCLVLEWGRIWIRILQGTHLMIAKDSYLLSGMETIVWSESTFVSRVIERLLHINLPLIVRIYHYPVDLSCICGLSRSLHPVSSYTCTAGWP